MAKLSDIPVMQMRTAVGVTRGHVAEVFPTAENDRDLGYLGTNLLFPLTTLPLRVSRGSVSGALSHFLSCKSRGSGVRVQRCDFDTLLYRWLSLRLLD